MKIKLITHVECNYQHIIIGQRLGMTFVFDKIRHAVEMTIETFDIVAMYDFCSRNI